MKHIINVLILPVIIFLVSGCADYKSPALKTLYLDYQAGRDIKNEKYEEALQKYYSLLEADGDRASIHSNIGVLLNGIQKPDEALKSLQYALKLAEASANPEMIFKIHYNLGVYYGALKKVPEALSHYQAALDMITDSPEIKTNIELLMQQQKQDQKQNKNQSEQKDKKPESDKDKKPDSDKDSDKDKESDPRKNEQEQENKKKQSSPKYQPRPFKGDELSEADVKKILGELKNQEQKIRANFDKKEKKGKEKNNEKDW